MKSSTPEWSLLDAVGKTLQEIFGDLLGIPTADVRANMSFLELGAESLLLMRASQAITDRLGVKVPFRDLLGRYPTVERLAEFVLEEGGDELADLTRPLAQWSAQVAPASEVAPIGEIVSAGQAASADQVGLVGQVSLQAPDEPRELQWTAGAPSPPPSQAGPKAPPGGGLNAIMLAQLQLMIRQLDVLRDAVQPLAAAGEAPPEPVVEAPPEPVVEAPPEPVEESSGAASSALEMFIPYEPVRPHEASDLSARHRDHVERLVAALLARTVGSRRDAERHRQTHADSRMSAGFQLAWKEIVYPIVADRAQGSRFVDVDGNEYVDITMDYGVNLFGHNACFIADAITEQLSRGMPIGPHAAQSGPVAELVHELTGVERVAFVNSGTEAVMVAVRTARTVTHRPKVAVFSGCFHGTFDGILARASTVPYDPPGLAVPLAPGVAPSAMRDVIMAEYGDRRAFDVLERHGSELAAVLVEPVQSRRPQLQPAEWLRQLRELTTRLGAALIFDEIITGFRLHPGGAQEWLGIRADLVTYGKVLGGGMPIGAVAGNADFMAAIDGGVWGYGDASWPSAETTLFAGTFWKHPLVMAAAHAVLSHLRDEGPALQERLNARTARLVAALNDLFERERVPIRVVGFASLFRFVFGRGVRFVDLFFYHLLLRGVYVWEGRTCYLSTAHTDADVELVVEAVADTVAAMRADGLVPSEELSG